MSFDFGFYGIVLATLLATLQMLGLLKRVSQNKLGTVLIETCAVTQSLATGFALVRLLTLYLNSDTSVLNVALNSHHQLNAFYKLTALWSNHEGSWLLWLFLLSLCGATFTLCNRQLESVFRAKVLGLHGLCVLGFYLFLIFTSNPFVRLDASPIIEQGLNPLLEDFSLGFHPPILYLGYAGLSIVFAQGLALLQKQAAHWHQALRSWTLLSWSCLTIGLAWGSWWAYYELGWGGWWFWDPVENAALVPWLTSTALIHSLKMAHSQNTASRWTLFLTLTTFLLCLIGIVFVRSGLVTTVHAFAIDPGRGLFLVVLVGVYIAGSCPAFLRSTLPPSSAGHSLRTRDGSLFLISLGLFFLSITILFATFYPVGLEALTGQKISVGAPYFNKIIIPFALPLMLLMGLAIHQTKQRTGLNTLFRKLLPAAIVTMLVLLFIWLLQPRTPIMAMLALGFAAWITASTLSAFWQSMRTQKMGARKSLGMTLGHLGFAITLIGMTADIFWQERLQSPMKPGDQITLAGHKLSFLDTSEMQAPHFRAMNARFSSAQAETVTQRRLYLQQKVIITKTGLLQDGFSQIYLALGDYLQNQTWLVSATWHPLVTLIWLGAILMAVGGFIPLLQRKRPCD